MNKKIFILLATFAFFYSNTTLHAQDMYGTASAGGQYNVGTIYKLDSSGRNQKAVHHFKKDNDAAQAYQSKPCEINGKIYGTTESGGGSQNKGVLYEYEITTGIFKTTPFKSSDGAKPYSDPIVGSNGKLYGLTSQGGKNNTGALYEFDPSTGKITLKASMIELGSGIRAPRGRLVETTSNVFYGTASSGGNGSKGVLFEYDLTKDTMIVVHHFEDSTGHTPGKELMYAKNGKVYGVTAYGNAHKRGGIWELDLSTKTYKVVHDIAPTEALTPLGGLVEVGSGLLYGMTSTSIFQYNIATDTLIKKQTLTSTTGQAGESALIVSNDKLYAFARDRGAYSGGSVIEYDPSKDVLVKKYDFNREFNGGILGTPLIASNGKMYGSTLRGGTSANGVLFELNLSTKDFQTKQSFSGALDGGSPGTGLLLATDKIMYGTTSIGGIYGKGVLYSFDPKTATYTKHHDFIDSTGSKPMGNLMQANDGNLYGMTYGGGEALGGNGVLFKFNPVTKKYTRMLAFDYKLEGSQPQGDLMQASDGKLYGMTANRNWSSIFQYTIGADSTVQMHKFVTETGRSPYGGLVEDSPGKLYGMTTSGGAFGQGVLFELIVKTKTYRVVTNFDGANNGQRPSGSLLKASNGVLYGMTSGGGMNSRGVLFEYNVAADTLVVKYHLSDQTGQNPISNLMEASNGKLYANTGYTGTIIEYDFVNDTLKKTISLSATEGYYPHKGSLVQYFGNGAPCNLDKSVTQNGKVLTANAIGVNYQWVDCEDNYSAIAGATSRTFTATRNGEFAVIINNTNCTDTSLCNTVITVGHTGQSLSNQFELFPNPTHSIIKVRSSIDVSSLTLIDVTGHEMLFTQNSKMDLSEVPSGVYFLKISLDNQIDVIFKKVIKE